MKKYHQTEMAKHIKICMVFKFKMKNNKYIYLILMFYINYISYIVSMLNVNFADSKLMFLSFKCKA